MKDFTLQVYSQLLSELLKAGYELTTFRDYVSRPQAFEKVAIIRHDVDKMPRNATMMARREEALGIRATYYFRIVRESFDAAIMKDLAAAGHEVGYHYEDLTLARGDLQKATQLFEKHLATFREVCPIETICMHGSPLSKWDNRLLFEHVNYRDYGIVSEPYFDLDFDQVYYLTDTGRVWNGSRIGVRDKVASRFSLSCRTTFDIMAAARSGSLPKHVMINTHPQRWNDDLILWGREYVMQRMKNVIKRGIVTIRG